jgi:hypothetical protein
MNFVKDNMEMIASVAILVLTAAIAADYVRFPYLMMAGHSATIIMVIAALGAFAVYPAAGLSLFLLTAVLFFKRNVHRTVSAMDSKYGETTIAAQPHVKAQPYESAASGPRHYNQFQETNPSNPMLGPQVEGFEPAPYGDEQGSPVEGQYPTDESRISSSPEALEYVYRPDPETGSNAFQRYGPDLDEKKKAFQYSA